MTLGILGLAAAGILVEAAGARLLVEAGATVLDARGRLDFLRGHIPGAQRVEWRIGTVGGPTSGKLGEPEGVAAAFSALGVRNESPVLVVGSWDQGWGEEGRIAWDLLYLGHREVHLLRGGMSAWTGPVEYLGASPVPGNFSAAPRPDYRGDSLAAEGRMLLDVREPEEYAGAQLYGEARGGHVEGAISLPWKGFLTQLPALERRPTLVYCTGGVRSAMVWVLLKDAGFEVANDDGGWWEAARRKGSR